MLEPAKERFPLGGRVGGLDPRGLRFPDDYGDIGEDGDGIWLKRTPEAMILELPELWPGLHRFELGHSQLRPEDADELDGLEFHVLQICIDTAAREQRRREKAQSDSFVEGLRRGR
ncbi:MAG: hypothetical protein AAGJ19_13780 [Myxococcota bacterium]